MGDHEVVAVLDLGGGHLEGARAQGGTDVLGPVLTALGPVPLNGL